MGGNVHLAHPLGNNWGHRRVKNDERDATDLVDLLRIGRLAEGWVAPPPLRELRELVRYRAKLVNLRSGLKAQVHSVLAKEGVTVPMTDLFGKRGQRLLDEVELGHAYLVSAVKPTCRSAYTLMCRSRRGDQSLAPPPLGSTWSFSR